MTTNTSITSIIRTTNAASIIDDMSIASIMGITSSTSTKKL